jgi:hypothetical protein
MADGTATSGKPHTLDDLMVAMDVVDTIRHNEDLVRREINEPAREAELIERLREIYRQQGIDVSDRVLEEGVKALKESRFTYAPPPRSWKRTLLELWVGRTRYGKVAGAALAVLALLGGYRYIAVVRPAQLAAEQSRIEIVETLPKAIHETHADILRVATDPSVKTRADQLLMDGERAIRDKDRAAMSRISHELQQLRDNLLSEYTLTIVSRPGDTTGVWRQPPKGSQSRNYYLIVGPITPDGRKLKIPVRNEETGETAVTDKFGVRVPEATWEAVAADKRDDGIVQKNRFGVKRRGTTSIDYLMPYDGGMITKW